MSKFTNNELDTMALIGDVARSGAAWWGGAHFSGSVPEAEVRRLLGWTPVKSPVFMPGAPTADLTPDGVTMVPTFAEIPGKCVIVNPTNGKALGIFSDGYEPHPYSEYLLDMVGTLLEASAGELFIGSAGCLGNGEQAWVQVRPAEGVTVGGDQLLPWLAAFSSLDGSLATTYKAVATRIVCDNTLAMAGFERSGKAYKLKHTRYSKMKVAEARDAIGLMWTQADNFASEVERLMGTVVIDAQFSRIVDRLVPIAGDASKHATTIAETKRDRIRDLYANDMRVAPWAGSAWGVLQAVNTWDQHYATVRGATRNDRRVSSTIDGTFAKSDVTTLEVIGEVIGRELVSA